MAIQRPTAAPPPPQSKVAPSVSDKSSSSPSAAVAPSGAWRSNVASLISTGASNRKGRSFGSIFCDDGRGKTTFITRYSPAPLFLLSLDGRADFPIAEAEEMGRKVYHSEIYLPSTTLTSDAIKLAALDCIEQVVAVLEWAVSQPEIKTIGIDPTSKLDTMFNVAFFGRFENWDVAFKKDITFIKRQWGRITDLLRHSDKNIIFTSRESAIWDGSNGPNGKFREDCSKSVRNACDWSGHLRAVERAAQFGGGLKFEIEIMRAKPSKSIAKEGDVYKEKDWAKLKHGPFELISNAVYGEGNWRK